MIAYLKGILIEKSTDRALIDVNGVGYSAHIPLSTFLKLSDIGEPVELLVYTHMTDSSLALYGFHSAGEKDLFIKLIGISGIGPKIGLSILSGIGTTDLKEAIQKGDVSRLSLIPGIGKKTAMRITLELQEKIGREDGLEFTGYQEKEDLISALMNLGFKRKEVEKVVNETIKALSADRDLDTLLRESLRRLSRL